MNPNWQQSQYGGFQQQPTGQFRGGGGGGFMGPQPTGFMGQQQQQQQQPMQTGFGGQQQQQQRPMGSNVSPLPTGQQPGLGGGGNYSFLNTQPTGFRPSFTGASGSGGMNPQMTGFPGGGASGLLSQPTGYGAGPGMMSQPTGMGMGMGGGGMMSQPTGMGGGMMSQPTGMGGGLMSQPTGMGGLRAQPTGVHDPRLQTMMQSFMPSNMSQPFTSSGVPQFQQTQQPLQQQFQSLLQNPSVKTPKVPWVLTKQEKKDYDQIFRAWDTDGDGFITGETAREVFGQSGLDQDGLMKIWTLSDVDNRGKLNLPEFHVAMGLIYRALNGNDIPDRLPEELIPASMRDIDTTVSFMKDLLKHEASSRSNTSSPAYGSSAQVPASGSRDATAYKHDDTRPSGYKPSSRHLDRKSVRYAGEDSGAEIDDLKRQLANTSAMLDKSNNDYMRKTEEDEQLEQDVDDLKYRVKRIQDDIEYLTKGRRSTEKDEERRKLEREMLFLMHEKLPELERRQQQREDDKRREERSGTRARDRRNDTHGRYRDDRDEDRDRDWLKGSYDRDRQRERNDSRDRYRRDSRDRSRDRYDSRDRPRSPPRDRTPPPAPPAPSSAAAPAPLPPAPPAPTSKAAAAPSTANMTPEEKKAFIREQAQRRIQERLKALGVESSQPEQPAVDKSVEERLEREKKEAEEKSKSAEKEQEAREEARRQRLQGGGAKSTDEPASASAAAPASPAGPLKSAMKKPPAAPPAPVSRSKPTPPAPKSRAAPPSPAPAPAPAKEEEEDPEEVELRRKEEARQKAREERRARMAALEAEEEEERKKEEALLAARQSRAAPSSSPAPPPAPPAPPAPAPAPASGGGNNPFRKPGQAAAAPVAGGGGGFNPFFKPSAAPSSPSPAATPTVTSPAPAPPPPPPAPPAPAPAPISRAPPPVEDEWERIEEKADDSDADSSDDDYANSRSKRAGLASALFGNITGGPRQSAPQSQASTPPPAPRAPPAALANLGGATPAPGGGGMSALLSSIQGGARLKKAQTVDKSAPPVSGKVIGGADVPDHINTGEPAPATGRGGEEEMEDESSQRNPNRQSVDWLGGLANDSSRAGPAESAYSPLETVEEQAQGQDGIANGNANGAETPSINVESSGGDELDDFDMSTTLRVRTLFAYEGQRDVDLSFIENVVVEAHPAKDTESPWWYGTLVKEGKSGWFPHTYVEEMKPVQAKASFTYDGQSEDELPFVEGDILTIVDTSDSDWWKTEKAGVIFIVPASYFELLGSSTSKVKSGTGISTSVAVGTNPQIASDTSSSAPRSQVSPTTTSNHLSPSTPALASAVTRPRSSTMNSFTSATGTASGYESSSGDSMLSFWSSDDSDSGSEADESYTEPEPEPEVKELDRKKREEDRQKVLEQAGLKLRREAPGVPGSSAPPVRSRTRRRAPAAPGAGKRRRPAPGVPPVSKSSAKDGSKQEEGTDAEGGRGGGKLDTLDAYARYENYLAQSQAQSQPRTSTPKPGPSSTSTALSPSSSTATLPIPTSPTTRPGRSSSIISQPSASASGSGGRFTGLISRIMAPSSSAMSDSSTGTGGRKSISIVRVDDDNASGRATPVGGEGVGGTWTSLVESSVLETMSDKERKRQEAIFEFIATEGSYNRDLQLIVEVFYASMLDILDDKALTVIFANIEDLLLTATSFLSELEQRQKACRLYVDVIGDILEEHIGRMRVYMTYCVNQQQAIKLLQSLRESNPALAAHLQSIRENNPSVRGLDLSSFLLLPMQRITRYPLLLRQILQYTSSDQDFSSVQSSLNEAENITAAINESVRDAEGDERLRVLSEDLWIGGEGRLDLTAPTAYQGPRKLLKEGSVTKAKSGRKLTMVLCNDIIVLAESRNLYRMPIPLHEVQAREGREETFQLKVEFHRGGDTIGVKATSAREAKEWVAMINKHRNLTMEARNESERRRHQGFSF